MIKLLVSSERKEQIVNITAEVRKAVRAYGLSSGLALVSVPHTTASIFLSEDDPELREDLVSMARTMLSHVRPFKHRKNDNPNAEAHIISTLLGSRITIPVEESELLLGEFQNILFLELDGPKKRSVEIFLYPTKLESSRLPRSGGAA